MKQAKLSLITTVFNEQNTIIRFLQSVFEQSKLPDEIIIVDGGSTDNTLSEISRFKFPKIKNPPNIKILFKKGNRSIGRNEAIKNTKGEIILSSDAGNVLDKYWIENIVRPLSDKRVDVVAGYYRGISKNIFQKSLIPYVLVMEDKINEKEFLPATRSMAFKKSIWKKAGGFDEKLSHNEDYAFANKLKEINAKIVFEKKAIANWIPRKNLKEAFIMFFRFALGDAESNIYRDKVIFIFLRYIFAAYLIALIPIMRSVYFDLTVLVIGLFYIIWSIKKNYRYVNDSKALIYLPLLQFSSDFAVITGTITGFFQSLSIKRFLNPIINNKILLLIILFYSTLMFLLLEWGIPNLNHPFNYAMDEWHFSQALRTFFKYGSGSISGAASIPFYHIVSSILFLIPFYLLHIVNPLAIKYTLDNLPMQHTLFEILRLHTLFYGIMSAIVMYNLFKNFLKSFPAIFTALFIFNPIWISLTNYYKYDVTLSFWIITTLYLLIKYFKTQKLSYFVFAGISCGLALSTKFTAAPLLAAYFLGYFILSDKIRYKEIVIGILTYLSVFAFIGIPDLIFGRGSYYQLLYSTLIQSPQASLGFNLGYPSWFFLLFKEFPSTFGYFLTVIFYLSLIFWPIVIITKFLNRQIKEYKIELFIYITTIIFLLPIISFGVDGGGNRSLVLITFMIMMPALFVKYFLNNFGTVINKRILLIVLVLGLFLQILQSVSWISVKFYPDPREVSSNWILKNVPTNSSIGIENIPIYQMLPDFVLREFYFKQHDNKLRTKYQYSIVSSKDRAFPKYVIVTNDFDNVDYVKNSQKKELVKKLQKDNYKKIKEFSPNLKYYNIFADKIYFVFTNIMSIPVTISIYGKQ